MKISSVDLSKITTYRFGGVCKSFIELEGKEDLNKLNETVLGKENIIIGKGSNVAFSDKEFQGNVISPKFTSIEEESETEITVGASVFLPDLSRYFKENVYSNGEFLIGIPGTVGGAVKMNAGAYDWEFSDLIQYIECFDLNTSSIIKLTKDDINFSYRCSQNLDNKIILSATLKIEKGDINKINSNLANFNKIRKNSQPPAIYNAGSVFKNTKDFTAGKLIDEAGLKGYEIDGVSVSEKHANFFIAKKEAKSLSLYKLVQHVKEVINSKFGIRLEEEIIFIGDFDL
jgi:UDP-N-acetylmuramate dehydrogenase